MSFGQVEKQSTDDEVYLIVESAAVPQGGITAFYQALGQSLVYPPEARQLGIEGRVFVEFVVEKDGSLTNIKVIKGLGAGCDEAAVKAVAETQKLVQWTPGTHRGKPVRQRFTLPVSFKLR